MSFAKEADAAEPWLLGIVFMSPLFLIWERVAFVLQIVLSIGCLISVYRARG